MLQLPGYIILTLEQVSADGLSIRKNPDTFFEIKPRGYAKKLNIEHKGFLVEIFDKGPAATIEDAIEELSANFEGIKIGSTAVHDFLKVEIHINF